MHIETLIPPAAEPLLLAELADHLRLSGADETAALGGFIAAARAHIEGCYSLALIHRTVKITLNSKGGAGDLPLRPISTVTEIARIKADGTRETLDESSYSLKVGLQPRLTVQGSGVYEITATAGFGADWNTVPDGIRQALLMLAAWLYTHRGDGNDPDPVTASGAAALMQPYRRFSL